MSSFFLLLCFFRIILEREYGNGYRPWEHTLEHTLVCIFLLFLFVFRFSVFFFCYLFTIQLFTFVLSLFLFSPPGAANALYTVIWFYLSLDRHGLPKTQRIALFWAVVYSTARRESPSFTRHWRRYRRDGSAHQLLVLTAHLVVFDSGMLQRIM